MHIKEMQIKIQIIKDKVNLNIMLINKINILYHMQACLDYETETEKT